MAAGRELLQAAREILAGLARIARRDDEPVVPPERSGRPSRP
jgi:hypothetical protein